MSNGQRLTKFKLDPIFSKRQEVEVLSTLQNGSFDANLRLSDGKMLLESAIEKGWEDVASFLIEEGANVNQETLTNIMYKDLLKCIDSLVKKEINIYEKDDQGQNILHKARSVKMVDLLVSLGFDINAQDKEGNTPEMLAEIRLNQYTKEKNRFIQKARRNKGYKGNVEHYNRLCEDVIGVLGVFRQYARSQSHQEQFKVNSNTQTLADSPSIPTTESQIMPKIYTQTQEDKTTISSGLQREAREIGAKALNTKHDNPSPPSFVQLLGREKSSSDRGR